MAEYTVLRELQAEIRSTEELLERRTQEKQELTAATNTRMERIERALEWLVLQQARSIVPKFPKFDGTNVLEWIFSAERFLDYYATPDRDRLIIASIHMENHAIRWYQLMMRLNPFDSWKVLESGFGPSPYDSPRPALFKSVQSGSVNDYYEQFLAFANWVHGLSGDVLPDCFASSCLQDDIKRDVLVHFTDSISKAVSLARLYEEKYHPTVNVSQPLHNNTRGQNWFDSAPASRTPQPRQRAIKRMSAAEMLLRREQGLCFTCEEKFALNHKCPNRHLLILQTD